MTIAFVTNVGSRDVIVEGRANLPKDSRSLGELILADWETYKGDLRLPILLKALDSVLKRHQHIDRIVLFASDQDNPTYRHTDTWPFAEIVVRCIRERYGEALAEKCVLIKVRQNPSDYDQMMHFYVEEIRKLLPFDQVYTAVTGGTPAMSFMLLWHGVEILQERVQPIYVIQERPLPLKLNIGQAMLLNAITGDLRNTLHAYQYEAAHLLLQSRAGFLQANWPRYVTIVGLTEYARQRFNFNFDLAEGALFGIEMGVSAAVRQRLDALVLEISQRDAIWLIMEEIYGADIDFRNGAYKDGITHVFAFAEAMLREIARREGVQFQRGETPQEQDKFIDLVWLETLPDLKTYLEGKSVRLNQAVNTFVFKRILGYFAKTRPALKKIMEMIDTFETLQDVRNKAIHKHAGVSEAVLEQSYVGGAKQILADMRTLVELSLQRVVAPNPYDPLNALIDDLMKAQDLS